MFEHLRRSLDELLQRATKPEDRRSALVRMRSTLVQVRVGVDDLRDALARTRQRLEAEERELDTVRRRKALAEQIQDAETVKVADRFEQQHAERARVLAEKVAVQERELVLAEKELDDMKAEMRRVMAGGLAPGATTPLDDPLADPEETRVREELDGLLRERARSERDADADRRLEELKRKMGR